MTKFVTQIKELPIASDRARADIAGNSIVDTYATKTEGAKVSVSEGQAQGYLSEVLLAGNGITLTESNGTITASANIKILQYGEAITTEEWNDLHDKVVEGDLSLFCKYQAGLYPVIRYEDSKFVFFGTDSTSFNKSKSRFFHLYSTGKWEEGAINFVPHVGNCGTYFRGVASFGEKKLTAKNSNYWSGYWVPVFSIPIGRFVMDVQLMDASSEYSTSYCIHLMGIDKSWLTASYTCLNTEKDYLRIWMDDSNWYIGFDGTALSDSLHTIKFKIDSDDTYTFRTITEETRLDPSALDISGVHLQKPVANTVPDWDQSAPVTSASDSSEPNPEQGSTELS